MAYGPSGSMRNGQMTGVTEDYRCELGTESCDT